MKKTNVIYFLLVLIIIISIYTSYTLLNLNVDVKSTKENSIDNIIKYKNSYVGDNSAVNNILETLPGGNYKKQITLKTESLPYGIEVDYGIRAGANIKQEDFDNYWSNEQLKKVFLSNATALFILVKNVDTITFNVELGQVETFTISRKELEEYYGKDLRKYAENTSLWEHDILEGTLKSKEKLDEFFKFHSINVKKTVIKEIS